MYNAEKKKSAASPAKFTLWMFAIWVDMAMYVFSESSDALFILLHFFISLKYDFHVDAELKHEKCKKISASMV